jgi:mannosyl-3-phosphoglycerate phosphatase
MPSQLKNKKHIIIFTDLDGTLLDHHNYSHDAAKVCLNRIADIDIPIIPNTSKTFLELLELRKKIELDGPFIIENGAALMIPQDFFPEQPEDTVWKDGFWVKIFSAERPYWLDLLSKLEPEFGHLFESFNDMSLNRIIEVTGLSESDAYLSSNRQFGEPLLWKGNDQQLTEFIGNISKLGAFPVSGGRFVHIGGECSKGLAMDWFLSEYRRQYKGILTCSIALGDGQNDVSMLEAADYAVRIASPVNEPPVLQRKTNLYTSKQYGPKGWAEVLEPLIPELMDSN